MNTDLDTQYILPEVPEVPEVQEVVSDKVPQIQEL